MNTPHVFVFILMFAVISNVTGLNSRPCIPRKYGFSSFVCVCNSTYCDTVDATEVPVKGTANVYESNKNQNRFAQSHLKFLSQTPPGSTVFEIDRTTQYQFIVGFGGAFTDSAGINIASLPQNMQQDIINGYFSKTGLEYSMGRVPMASCDFSTHVYSYADTPDDFDLKNFTLAHEDFIYKIPYIKMAQKAMNSGNLLLFGSPWSAPGWMKTNGQMYSGGSIRGNPGEKYYQTWANYFVKFLDAYAEENITFWGVTVENEPTFGLLSTSLNNYQSMGFTPELERDFIKLNLGPTLQKAGYGTDKLKLMIMDDQRFLLPRWANTVLGDEEAAKYVSGIAFHWYWNKYAPADLLEITHNKHPDVFILPTEACSGVNIFLPNTVQLGSWERAEDYAHDIIQDLLHWSIGWIDWNLALDTGGGPNWVKNFVDSPILVNSTAEEFYRQPMYYALAHFSKILPPGSRRIGGRVQNQSTQKFKLLDIAAFQIPQNMIAVIAVNRGDDAVSLSLHDPEVGFLNSSVGPHSIQSYIWTDPSSSFN